MKALRSWGERDLVEERFLWYAAAISFGAAAIALTYTQFGLLGLATLCAITLMVCGIVVYQVYMVLIAVNDDHDELFDAAVDMTCKGFCAIAITLFAVYQLTLHASRDELLVLGLMVGLYLLGSLKSWGAMWLYRRVHQLLTVNSR